VIAVDGFDISLKLDAEFIPISQTEEMGLDELDYGDGADYNISEMRKQKLHGVQKFAIEDQDQDPSIVNVDMRGVSGLKIV
jgi:hypothetical protein